MVFVCKYQLFWEKRGKYESCLPIPHQLLKMNKQFKIQSKAIIKIHDTCNRTFGNHFQVAWRNDSLFYSKPIFLFTSQEQSNLEVLALLATQHCHSMERMFPGAKQVTNSIKPARWLALLVEWLAPPPPGLNSKHHILSFMFNWNVRIRASTPGNQFDLHE